MLRDDYTSKMGYTVRLCEVESHGYVIFLGGRSIKKRDGEIMVYSGVDKAVRRFRKEVASVESLELRLIAEDKWHPVQLCAGGCGLEMRDGRIDQSEPIGRIRCVSCGPWPLEAVA